jgi:hypothetical protein
MHPHRYSARFFDEFARAVEVFLAYIKQRMTLDLKVTPPRPKREAPCQKIKIRIIDNASFGIGYEIRRAADVGHAKQSANFDLYGR